MVPQIGAVRFPLGGKMCGYNLLGSLLTPVNTKLVAFVEFSWEEWASRYGTAKYLSALSSDSRTTFGLNSSTYMTATLAIHSLSSTVVKYLP